MVTWHWYTVELYTLRCVFLLLLLLLISFLIRAGGYGVNDGVSFDLVLVGVHIVCDMKWEGTAF